MTTRYEKFIILWLAFAVVIVAGRSPAVSNSTEQLSVLDHLNRNTRLYEVEADVGRKTRLVYDVPVGVKVFWRFKTDFNNDWLLSNKYIQAHRFISRRGNVVLSETKYTYGPDVYFRWRTELFPGIPALRYTLLNAEECQQKFNRGWIRLEPAGENMTRVTHTSHFDFTGAFIWANLPGPWGMAAFMRYTARWEQETILRLQADYTE